MTQPTQGVASMRGQKPAVSEQPAAPPPQPQQQKSDPELSLIGPDGTAPSGDLALIGPDGARPGQTVTAGLLEEAPVFESPAPQPGEGVGPARQIANETDAANPVAMQEDMVFGAIPMPEEPGLNSLLDEPPERRQFAMEDPNPTRPVDTKSQARHGQAGPQYNYQTAGSWTSSTPSFSYKRV